jgi:hypothetical protein
MIMILFEMEGWWEVEEEGAELIDSALPTLSLKTNP